MAKSEETRKAEAALERRREDVIVSARELVAGRTRIARATLGEAIDDLDAAIARLDRARDADRQAEADQLDLALREQKRLLALPENTRGDEAEAGRHEGES